MRIEILKDAQVVNTVIASEAWAEANFDVGTWRVAAEQDETIGAHLTPRKVTRRQARQALLLAGLLDQVEPAIESITDDVQRKLALIEWQDSLEFERHRPLLITLGAALGLDEAALDQLFITAATL